MGLILDSSILIATERKRFDLLGLFEDHPDEEFLMSAVSASELLHGVERARSAKRRAKRKQTVDHYIENIPVVDFDLSIARRHAEIWTKLEAAGKPIGAHDMMIAATALYLKCRVVTLNVDEFRRVPGLKLLKTGRYIAPASQ